MGVIPAGTWLVKIKQSYLGKSKTGTGYVALIGEDDQGDRITAYLYLSDKTIDRSVETLEGLGWDAKGNNGDLSSLHESELLLGNEAEFVIEDETYEGRTRPKVKFINVPGAGPAQTMAIEDAKAFAATLRAKVFGAKAGKPATAPKPTSSKPAARPAARPKPDPQPASASGVPDKDDDIPF